MTSNTSIRTLVLLVGLALAHCTSPPDGSEAASSDILIYGGTSAAVIAAVQVKHMGLEPMIVCPEKHLGGMTASGLGWTDTGNKAVIGGLARDFYHRIYQAYLKPEAWPWQDKSEYGNRGQGNAAIDGENRTMWIFEPHLAEEIFEQYIDELDITVHRGEWLDRVQGVKKNGTTIESITTLSGKTYRAHTFIDATYEGDLLAAAGCRYHVGREACDVYGESWNGIQVGVLHHRHHFMTDISPYRVPGDPSSGVLPRISTADPGQKCQGDDKVQAYCFRTCLTQVSANRVPFQAPEDYQPDQYALLARILESGWRETFHKFDPIPNWKTDVNNHGPFSFDNIGMNYEYPEATYDRRREIIEEHTNYQQGLLYFLANDPQVPQDVREEMSQWGYAKDEFVDNGHWPHQIYVREARRLIGQKVMTEHEVLGKNPVAQPIGMGAYTMDSHNTQRYIKPDGYVQNEGDIGVRPDQPYQIELGALLPQVDECNNLVVPVCLSSSHIAFGSIRMEPVFMILGQSAATLAALAASREIGVQEVPYVAIKEQLVRDGQILEYRLDP